MSESKSRELQSNGLQKQQPIPGGGLASEVQHIWTTDMSLSDLRKIVRSQEPLSPFEKRRTVAMAMAMAFGFQYRLVCSPFFMGLCTCVHVYVGGYTCKWRSKDNLGCQSSDIIHQCVLFCLFYSLSVAWSLLSRLDWLSNP